MLAEYTSNGHHPDFKQFSSSTPATRLEDSLSQEELVEIWAKRADALAAEPEEIAVGETLELLVFRLGQEWYGVDVTNVRETYPLEQLTPVPRTPSFVAGVFSARGRILSIIDLQAFLGLAPMSLSDQTKIIVVSNQLDTTTNFDGVQANSGTMEIGLIADDVTDVISINVADIEPPLTTHTGTPADYIRGITPDMMVVINLNTLLTDSRLMVQEELL